MDKQLFEIYNQLGITEEHLVQNKLKFYFEQEFSLLKVVDIDLDGRPFILKENAAVSWNKMIKAAQDDGIKLMPYSGFRSYIHQKNLIEKHLKNGRSLESIFTHIAIPGFSEHHSGRAVDIHAFGNFTLEEAFESSNEFKWLSENAFRFNFKLSYPRDNSLGIIYEPWHWFFEES